MHDIKKLLLPINVLVASYYMYMFKFVETNRKLWPI